MARGMNQSTSLAVIQVYFFHDKVAAYGDDIARICTLVYGD